jgi:hypothetical protein
LTAADEAAGDESGWDLIVYGYNDLLTDEPCPVTEPLDEAFYNDLLKAAEEQERQIGGYSACHSAQRYKAHLARYQLKSAKKRRKAPEPSQSIWMLVSDLAR